MTETILIEGKGCKRKRFPFSSPSPFDLLKHEDRDARVQSFRSELHNLFLYSKDLSDRSISSQPELGSNLNSLIACLIEESNMPLSRLVEEVYENVKCREVADLIVTMSSVKSSVIMIGQRLCYGVLDVDADLLEDDSESCLWCWETRDLKMMPKSIRGSLKIRRTGRKKIHERITAVSAMITALQNCENNHNFRHDLRKASEKLSKVLTEADIRLFVENMVQKNGIDMAEKEVKREEIALIKKLEKDKREAEKEKKKLDLELQKDKLCSEKELKRLQDEAEKDKRHREKEQSETKKQLKRQQEEAEKEKRRREKEECELKKKLAIQKQASIMERFLKKSKSNSTQSIDESVVRIPTSYSLTSKIIDTLEPITHSMDCALLGKDVISAEDIRSLHLVSWHNKGHHIRSWGIRKKPKTHLVTELSNEKLVNGCEESFIDVNSCHALVENAFPNSQKRKRNKQLLQFDKSNRPAFYGIWTRKSQTVGPRHPFKKIPELDYDIDSDEEWEEEDPGEDLSDCDKDGDDDLEEGCSKPDDEDESEDGFFVPDGYLSENEGAEVGRVDSIQFESNSLLNCDKELECEEIHVLVKQQKFLHNLTELALRKNQPLIILNLMHEKVSLLLAKDLSGPSKIEQTCLLALGMRAFHSGLPIDISLDNNGSKEVHEALLSNKGSTMPVFALTAISDCDLPRIVSAIHSSSQSIQKIVECLQQMFPSVPKTQLQSKVREISNFVNNRWQVKKDVLDKLGISNSQDEVYETQSPNNKGCSTPVATVEAIPDSDLPRIVSVIRSSSQSFNKVVESLHQIFPSRTKNQLQSKVREISNFVNNRWKVKKDVLEKLGSSVSPERSSGGKTKSIATFFSIRCHPPADKLTDVSEKPASLFLEQLDECANDGV